MRRLRQGLLFSVVILLSVGGCGPGPRGGSESPTTSATATTPTLPPASAQSEAPTPTQQPTAESPANPTAEGDVVAFVDAAGSADARLRSAAALINGAVRSTVVVVDARTVASVDEADPHLVSTAIPAGAPSPLLQAMLLVYSDLVSRHAAFGHVAYIPGSYPRGETDADEMVACLSRGAPAAAQFETDLAAVVDLAGSTPQFAAVEPSSLLAAELAVRLAEIELGNRGCSGCGGYLATTLDPIRWDPAGSEATTRTGVIGDLGDELAFEVTYTAGAGWRADLNAC